MTLKGADLLAWAQRKAKTWLDGRSPVRSVDEQVAALIAEAYLLGATDALAEETERIRNDAAIGRLGEAAILPDGDPWPTKQIIADFNRANWPDRGVADSAQPQPGRIPGIEGASENG